MADTDMQRCLYWFQCGCGILARKSSGLDVIQSREAVDDVAIENGSRHAHRRNTANWDLSIGYMTTSDR